ncbi:MAG: type III secretion system chaperone [Puniceicoccales bacterium]|nr:type III secretion system chaperone [Puniceicoccales bacterium]
MSCDQMANVISAFGREIGVALQVDPTGYCCLSAKNNLEIHLKFNPYFDGVIFYSEIGEVPEMAKKNVFLFFNHENASLEGSGFTFSYSQDSGQIGVACLLPSRFIELEHFKTLFEHFVNEVEAWSEKMLQFTRGEMPEHSGSSGSTEKSAEVSAEAPAPAGGIDPSFFMRV